MSDLRGFGHVVTPENARYQLRPKDYEANQNYGYVKVYRDNMIKVVSAPCAMNRYSDISKENRYYKREKEVKRYREAMRRYYECCNMRPMSEIASINFSDFFIPDPRDTFDKGGEIIVQEREKLSQYPEYLQKDERDKDSRFRQSLSRTKDKVFELAFCNDWDYFATFTLSPYLHDRYSLAGFNRAFSLFIRDLNRDYGLDIKYLSVPEQHKDGAWHIHALMANIPKQYLKPISPKSKYASVKLKKLIRSGRNAYFLMEYGKKFGNCSLLEIQKGDMDSTYKIAGYFCKYMTKELKQSIVGRGKRLFYSSHGLKRVRVIYRGGVDFDLSKIPDDKKPFTLRERLNGVLRERHELQGVFAFSASCARLKARKMHFRCVRSLEIRSSDWKHYNKPKSVFKPLKGKYHVKVSLEGRIKYQSVILDTPLDLYKFFADKLSCFHMLDTNIFGDIGIDFVNLSLADDGMEDKNNYRDLVRYIQSKIYNVSLNTGELTNCFDNVDYKPDPLKIKI